MKSRSHSQVIGIPVSSVHKVVSSDIDADSKQIKSRSKISETLKRKLSLGAKILQAGGLEGVFKQFFSVAEGEKLLKASQCYLSTSAGPIAGMLFVSTEKVAFHSDRPLTFTCTNGEVIKSPYKVLIPLRKIRRANPSENMKKPKEKHIQIVTVDNFEFWFMSFLNCKRYFKHLQMALSLNKLAEK